MVNGLVSSLNIRHKGTAVWGRRQQSPSSRSARANNTYLVGLAILEAYITFLSLEPEPKNLETNERTREHLVR